MKVKTVTIVGGGSSGWMSAAILSKKCPHLNIKLVESTNVPTIGVGESTLGTINRFLKILGLTDDMWMKSCNATYKNSIRFTNFKQNDGTSFHYPFTTPSGYDFTNKENGLWTWGEVKTLFPEEFKDVSFAQFYSDNTLLAEQNKQTNNLDNKLSQFNFEHDTAYHLDAQAFGQWIKNHLKRSTNFEHIYDTVYSYEKDEDGNISKIFTKNSRTLESDLWIDCTGFSSVLLEGWMQQKFNSFNKHLLNNSAIVCNVEYTDIQKQLVNYTDCCGLNNGWVWTIPLWDRVSIGYVYSSDYTDKVNAKKELEQYISEKGYSNPKNIKYIDIKHGYRDTAWHKNVVGVGLSFGFVEPLESTGLLTTHENLTRLTAILSRREGYVNKVEIEGYNYIAKKEIIGMKDFVSLHYAFSTRTDTPYWKKCTQDISYFDINDASNTVMYAQVLTSITQTNSFMVGDVPGYSGIPYILAGLGIVAPSLQEAIESDYSLLRVNIDSIELSKNKWLNHRDEILRYIDTLPNSYEFLRDNIYNK
jgi:tryptophan halogenase